MNNCKDMSNSTVKESLTVQALRMALEALKLNNREWKALADSGDSGQWSAEDQYHYQQTEEAIISAEDALAQPEQEKERCVGCEACIDTACGRDECPKGWPKAAQPEQVGINGLTEAETNATASVFGLVNAAPPQQSAIARKPLTDEQIGDIAALFYPRWQGHEGFARAIEAAHGIKE